MDHLHDYTHDELLAKTFLENFTHTNSEGKVEAKYRQIITKLAKRQVLLMVIDLADLDRFNHDLCEQVERNPMRYHQIFCAALDELLPPIDPKHIDITDVLIELLKSIDERNRTNQLLFTNPANISRHRSIYSSDLLRRAEIAFKPATLQAIPIKVVHEGSFGKLITTSGIVQSVAAVNPKITLVCYTCNQCGDETFQAVKDNEFSPLLECSSSACKTNETRGRLTMQARGSKFVKCQEIKIQEHYNLVPIGYKPKVITLIARGEQTGKCEAGDHLSVSGVLTINEISFPTDCGGFTIGTLMEVHHIKQLTETGEELSADLLSDREVIGLVQENFVHRNFLHRLSRSIAPEIIGHEDLKLALLLLLVGGVDSGKINAGGNINICLVGDPGVVKSRLLMFIDRLASKSRVITGRNSPGGSLTPAATKDPSTGKMTLGAGALILADQGVCCIDGFGKMTDAERAAIGEVMEQQTVSIGKDGKMKVRVSILAEVNPADGCYNVHKRIEDNLPVSPALLSHFDLLWLIQDRPGWDNDFQRAKYIMKMHSKLSKRGEQQASYDDTFDITVLRRYINLCKTKDPIIPPELDEKLTQIHLTMRTRNKTPAGATSGEQTETLPISQTARLTIVKLSTAFARLRFSYVVEEADIDEAIRLLDCSRASFENPSSI